jgi:hypothetical protein
MSPRLLAKMLRVGRFVVAVEEIVEWFREVCWEMDDPGRMESVADTMLWAFSSLRVGMVEMKKIGGRPIIISG